MAPLFTDFFIKLVNFNPNLSLTFFGGKNDAYKSDTPYDNIEIVKPSSFQNDLITLVM